jgi:hypothetical protein
MRLKQSQSVAARRRIPFVCLDTDGAPVTSATFVSNELMIGKNGAAEAAFEGTVTEQGGGLYTYEFTAAELNTVGFITARTNKSGIVAGRFFAQVVSHDDYGNYDVNVAAISGSAAAAIAAEDLYDGCPLGTVETANVAATNSGTCTFQATGIGEQTPDHFNGRQILFITGVMADSAIRITDYDWDAVNGESMFTCTLAQETPVDGTNFRII